MIYNWQERQYMRGLANMFVTQNGIHTKRTRQNRCVGYEALNRGGLVLLIISLFVISPFAIAAPSTLRITLGTFSPYYSPKFVHIAANTPIAWENPTSDLHTITHDGCKAGERCAFDSGPLGPNGTFTVRHLPPGYYPYHCSFHPIMQGTLVVTESDTSSKT
jgi:plastocyanin